MNLRVNPIKDPNVRVEVRSEGATVVTEFSGVLSHRDPSALLAPFFKELHQAMVDRGARQVKVDVRELRFMNSASFKHFVTWIRANGALPPEQRYRIHFVLNPAHHWQEVSIHALSCFSMDEITVEKLAVAPKR
jgi:hypothetical protein